MEVYEKLTKQIFETKYLNTENSWRYRPIMRIFYIHYEKLEYWLYKEDIYKELKDNKLFNDYTLEECERDLETLTDWYSLSKMQDTKNATSIEEFKNKKFRYQLTEYATEIERLMISLEEMEIKTASLEPKLFDRLRITISKLENIDSLSLEDINDIWNDLGDDFTKLNENYQDFLKKFNEPKSEELLQSELFLQFKSEIVKYLKDFIKGYQNNIYQIRNVIGKISTNQIDLFLSKLTEFYKSKPMLNQNFNFDRFREINLGKITNIFKWFIGSEQSISEGDKLMDTTNNIIAKITKYANSLIELHGNMTNRREEYKYLCKIFDKLNNIEEAHRYAATIFGISNVRHFIGNSNINTDTIVETYNVPPIEIVLSSRSKAKKEKVNISPIKDKSAEKLKILDEYRKMQEENRNVLKKLIKNKKIVLDGDMKLSQVERRYIQSLLSSSASKKETEFGLSYNIYKTEGKCKISSPDGVFYMNSLTIEFEGDL